MKTFDNVGEQFLDYYDTVRGAVRTDVTWHNLLTHISEGPAFAIDVGCGDGRDAVRLAQMGYEVTVVDESQLMLERARNLFMHAGHKFTAIEGNTNDLLEKVDRSYDVVLSHGVLMYCVDQPQQHIDALAELVAPNGIVSVLTKGFKGAMSRFSDETCQEAQDLKRTHRVVNNLGQLTLALTPNELNGMLRKTKLKVNDWYGVRIASENDRRQLTELQQGEYEQILNNEVILSTNRVKRPFGQMLHSIGEA